MWSWRDNATNTCLINRIWAKFSRCTCFPNLKVTRLIEISVSIRKYQFLFQGLHEYVGKSWNHCFDPPYWETFEIKNTDLQFRSPRKDGQENSGNCKALSLQTNLIMRTKWKWKLLAWIIVECFWQHLSSHYGTCFNFLCAIC